MNKNDFDENKDNRKPLENKPFGLVGGIIGMIIGTIAFFVLNLHENSPLIKIIATVFGPMLILNLLGEQLDKKMFSETDSGHEAAKHIIEFMTIIIHGFFSIIAGIFAYILSAGSYIIAIIAVIITFIVITIHSDT